jgi:hypothetical protein
MDSPSVQNLLGAAGGCPEIILGGKTWKIGHPTQRAKGVLEELVVSKAVAEIIALKRLLPAEQYSEMFKSLREAIESGDYHTGGTSWAKIALTGLNAHLFLLALLRENHPEATEEDARKLAISEPEQVQLALARVVPGFFDLLLSGLPLPPDQRAKVRAALTALQTPLSH